jgi:hypothetical protein
MQNNALKIARRLTKPTWNNSPGIFPDARQRGRIRPGEEDAGLFGGFSAFVDESQ